MFVVRLRRPKEEFDLKAFRSRRAALVRLRTAQRELIDGDVEACALFAVPVGDADRAIELVNLGRATLLESDLEGPRPRSPVRRIRAQRRTAIQPAATRKPTKRGTTRMR